VKSKEVLSGVLNTENLLETIKHIIDKEGIEELLRQGYELHINGVRRLTPLECERLQGYADGWTDIVMTDKKGRAKPISDNARYKALGNSVAVPCVIFLLERLKKYIESNGGIYESTGT
jgi:site-specific DNA-cytosine methylase